MDDLFPLPEAAEESEHALHSIVEHALPEPDVLKHRIHEQDHQVAKSGIAAIRQLFQEHGADGQERAVHEAQHNEKDK